MVSLEGASGLGSFGHKPVDITAETYDPALEHEIGLYELICAFDRLRRSHYPSTLIVGIYSEVYHQTNPPEYNDLVKALTQMPRNLRRQMHYYDLMALSYVHPNFELSLSPFITVYPIPALLKAAFGGIYSEDEVTVGEFISFFLVNRHVDRVIMLPRIRFKAGSILADLASLCDCVVSSDKSAENIGKVMIERGDFDQLLELIPFSLESIEYTFIEDGQYVQFTRESYEALWQRLFDEDADVPLGLPELGETYMSQGSLIYHPDGIQVFATGEDELFTNVGIPVFRLSSDGNCYSVGE